MAVKKRKLCPLKLFGESLKLEEYAPQQERVWHIHIAHILRLHLHTHIYIYILHMNCKYVLVSVTHSHYSMSIKKLFIQRMLTCPMKRNVFEERWWKRARERLSARLTIDLSAYI